MIAATPNERVCLQNCFDTGSDGYWMRRMRQLPRAPQRGPTTGPDGICAVRGTILHKSCRLQAAATFFLENAMILGRK